MNFAHSENLAPDDLARRPLAGIARGYFRFALGWLVAGLFAGMAYSLQFIEGVGENAIPAIADHAPARLRVSHSGIMIYGFLLNVLLGGLHAAASAPRHPRGMRRSFARVGLWAFQISILLGFGAALHGDSQPLPWGEFPAWADTFLLLSLAVVFLSVLPALDSSRDARLGHVFSWACVAVVFGMIAQGLWALLPMVSAEPAQTLRLSATFQSHLGSLFLFLAAFALQLYVLRLWLAELPWPGWLLGILLPVIVVLGPFSSSELYLAGDRPLGLEQFGALASGAYVAVLAVLVFGFLWAVRKGRARLSVEPAPGRRAIYWYGAGWIALALQLPERALLLHAPFLQTVQFTDWTIAHHHLLFLGVLGSWCFGYLEEFWPRLRGRDRWAVPFFADMHMICTLGGLFVMVAALAVAGLVQANLAAAGVPWTEVTAASQWLWITRLLAGTAMVFGQILLMLNILLTRPEKESGSEATGAALGDTLPIASRAWMIVLPLLAAASYAVAMGAIWRGNLYEEAAHALLQEARRGRAQAQALRVPVEFYDMAERNYPKAFQRHYGRASADSYLHARSLGAKVYAREGCYHCHTQQIRAGTADVDRWGEATRLEELATAAGGVPMPGQRRGKSVV